MTKCQFQTADQGVACKVCGRLVRTNDSPEKVHANCGPSSVRRVANFSTAVVLHLAAGMPKCSEVTIEERLGICRGCDLYAGDRCNHVSCGCALGDKQSFFNKLAWADQQCPLGKWAR